MLRTRATRKHRPSRHLPKGSCLPDERLVRRRMAGKFPAALKQALGLFKAAGYVWPDRPQRFALQGLHCLVELQARCGIKVAGNGGPLVRSHLCLQQPLTVERCKFGPWQAGRQRLHSKHPYTTHSLICDNLSCQCVDHIYTFPHCPLCITAWTERNFIVFRDYFSM